MPELSTGIVKWFDEAKGYGFISCDNGTDLIAYHTSINGSGLKKLESGQTVTFTIDKSSKGQQAVGINTKC
jgi:CspA family cold shock protein